MTDELSHRYDGWFTRIECGECGELFEVEDDPVNGEQLTCDACGTTREMRGRP